ncbi:MAG: EAL domain-containing protein [Pseudomonadota bacterium]|nr:EAL domain-containing protein [Pseudomonadota bacterium]
MAATGKGGGTTGPDLAAMLAGDAGTGDFGSLDHRFIRREFHAAGSTIVREGETGHCAYVIESGRVLVHSDARSIATLASGDIFGEMALIDAFPRSASVTSIEDCWLIAFERRYLDRAFRDAHSALPFLLRTLVTRLRGPDAPGGDPMPPGQDGFVRDLQRGQWFEEVMEEGRVLNFYQPILGASTEQVIGHEALLRWRDEKGQIRPPAELVAAAQHFGRAHLMMQHVLVAACRDLLAHDPAGDSFIAVNIEAEQLGDDAFVGEVAQVLKETGMNPRRLELEITEYAFVRDFTGAADRLQRLADLGVGITLDDFGTGYASMQALISLPFSKVKIDRSFVDSYPSDRRSGAIVDSVVALARRLGMKVTAEGVETPAQAQALALAGVDQLQGYLFARPGPAGERLGMHSARR